MRPISRKQGVAIFLLTITLIGRLEAAAETVETANGRKITVVNKWSVGDDFISEIKDEVQRIPDNLWRVFEERGVSVVLGRSLGDLDQARVGSNTTRASDPRLWEGLSGVYSDEDKKILIAQTYKQRDGRLGFSNSRAVLAHELGHAFDRLMQRGGEPLSASDEFKEAHQRDLDALAEQKDQFSYFQADGSEGRREAFAEAFAAFLGLSNVDESEPNRKPFQEAFARSVGFVEGQVNQILTNESLVIDEPKPMTELEPEVEASNEPQRRRSETNQNQLSATIPVSSEVPSLGSATLHVDVPNGAIIYIGEKRVPNSTRSRYRHFLIDGLRYDKEESVKVRVEIRNRGCSCPYDVHPNDVVCCDERVSCCKIVRLMAGDEEYVSFLETPKPTPAAPPAFTTPVVFLQGADPDATSTEAERSSVETTGTESSVELDSTTKFDFSWTSGEPVACTMTIEQKNLNEPTEVVGVSFEPAEVQFVADGPLGYPKSVLQTAEFAATLHVFDPRTDEKREFDFSPIHLKSVSFHLTGDKKGSTFQLRGSTDTDARNLYAVIREALVKSLDQSVFLALERDGQEFVDVELGGIVIIRGHRFGVGNPLKLTVRSSKSVPGAGGQGPSNDEEPSGDSSSE